MKREDLNAYFELMESFHAGRISAIEFESAYLALFKADDRQFPDSVFSIVNQLFSDVDMFVSNPDIRGPSDLDENQLLKCSREAYEKLDNLMKQK